MAERRHKTLTRADEEAIRQIVQDHSACRMGITHDDVSFLQRLNKGTSSVMSMVFKAFLLLVGVGIVVLAVIGFGAQMIKMMGGLA
jgi:hypothetical protein